MTATPVNNNNQLITPEGYTIVYALIDTALARHLLNANTNNRSVRAGNLLKIKNDMANGHWVFNGDAIRIDTNGTIIDGQHRLLAIEELGITIPALIVSGLPSESRATIDTNAVRNAGDELHMLGYTSANGLAAITAAYLRRKKSGLRAGVDQQSNRGSNMVLSTSEILEAVRNEPFLVEYNKVSSTRSYRGISRTIGSILYHEFIQTAGPNAKNDADYFFERLRDGAGLSTSSPILKLRNLLERIYNQSQHRTNKSYVAAVTIKAWNSYRMGLPMQNLGFRQGGANPEAFPTPV